MQECVAYVFAKSARCPGNYHDSFGHGCLAIMLIMAQPLPGLRMDLDFMPSPIEDRPGLLIRDNFHYSDAVLVIPPALVQCLQCFDGEQTELDLRQALVEITGELDVSG